MNYDSWRREKYAEMGCAVVVGGAVAKLRERAMQVHGKVCAIETRGPKHSLVLSVYCEHDGRTYEIRRGSYRNGQRIFKHFVSD